MKHVRMFLVMTSALLAIGPPFVWSQAGDSTHESGRLKDEKVDVLDSVHVHGLRLKKDPHFDHATHESDHLEDEKIEVLEPVHVHGFRLNKDQHLGPVPKYTPWPTMPPELRGQEVDDWMKARILVSKTAETTLVVLFPAKNRRINLAGIQALEQWTFDPQMDGDNPVDGELTVRLHFRTQEK